MVGLMNGGCWMLPVGNPLSSRNAGNCPLVVFGAAGFDETPRFGSPAVNC